MTEKDKKWSGETGKNRDIGRDRKEDRKSEGGCQ